MRRSTRQRKPVQYNESLPAEHSETQGETVINKRARKTRGTRIDRAKEASITPERTAKSPEQCDDSQTDQADESDESDEFCLRQRAKKKRQSKGGRKVNPKNQAKPQDKKPDDPQNNPQVERKLTFSESALTFVLSDSELEDTIDETADEKEDGEEDEDEVVELVDALKHPDGQAYDYTMGRDAVLEALQRNEEMQRMVINQLSWIDKRIQENEALKASLRQLSGREVLLEQSRLEIHKKYKGNLVYFVDKDGQTPFDNEEPSQGLDDCSASMDKLRYWHFRERMRLFTAVHAEAQREMALDLLARKEEWRFWELDKLPKETLEMFPVNRLNWQRISEHYVKTRTPLECMIQWTTQEHPLINKKPWSRQESANLAALVEKHGYEGQWEAIAVELGTNRTASQCFSHYQNETNTITTKRTWRKKDNKALWEAVELLGERNWQQIATMVGGRSGQQCLQRWMKSLNPAIRRSRWVKEEDDALRASVSVYGAGNWTKVQRHIPGRTDMQCRERWMNVLDPSLNHGPFTDEERAKLRELHNQYGPRWSLIAQHMPGRTDNHVYREWRSMNGITKSRAKASKSKNSKSKSDETPQRPPRKKKKT